MAVFIKATYSKRLGRHQYSSPPNQEQPDRFAQLVETYASEVANEDCLLSPGQSQAWYSYRSKCSAWKGGAA